LILAALFAIGGLTIGLLNMGGETSQQTEAKAETSAALDEKPWIAAQLVAAPTDRRDPEDLTPYEAVLRYFLYRQRISTQDHLITRATLEKAVERDEGYAELGNQEAAKNAAEDLLRIWPTVEEDHYQMGMVNWLIGQPKLIEQVNQSLRKAGINLHDPEETD